MVELLNNPRPQNSGNSVSWNGNTRVYGTNNWSCEADLRHMLYGLINVYKTRYDFMYNILEHYGEVVEYNTKDEAVASLLECEEMHKRFSNGPANDLELKAFNTQIYSSIKSIFDFLYDEVINIYIVDQNAANWDHQLHDFCEKYSDELGVDEYNTVVACGALEYCLSYARWWTDDPTYLVEYFYELLQYREDHEVYNIYC